jgi:RNA polymerase-binding transcription factor DksA
LSTLIAASDNKQTRNPKTQTIKKMLEQEGKNLNENIQKTEKYPPQDLANWMTQQQRKRELTDSEIRNRKQRKVRSNDTSAITRIDQVVISRLRTGYCRATYASRKAEWRWRS